MEFKFIILLVILYETLVCILRKIKRRLAFRRAQQRAREVNKNLLVIGDPYNGIASIATGVDYSCGDVCLDLSGCPRCPTGIRDSLENRLSGLRLGDYVVYISCVLEYVDDLPYILQKLETVPKENMFIVNVEWYSLMAYFYPYFLTGERPPKHILGPSGTFFKNPLA